jgi:hypothetical protein
MTDAAIAADGGAAPADIGGAPLLEVVPTSTSPLGSQVPPDARAENQPKPAASLDDVLDRAEAKVREKDAAKAKPEAKVDADAKPEVKADTKPEAKEPQPRDNGKFASTKPAEAEVKPPVAPAKSFTASEAPARFSDDAKAEWAAAPESVRRESERAIRELTEGHQKYRQAAERDSALNEFHEMAKQSGKELHGVVREYVNMENLLRQNPVQGVEAILQRVGITPRQYAEHILGQSPDDQASEQSRHIMELNTKIQRLEQALGGVQQTFQQQQESAVSKEVTQFKEAHPRFDELADDIAFFLKTRCPGDLAQAYELAERLNPAPAQADASTTDASSAPVIDLQAQTQKGNKSIVGAPSRAGSEPATKKRSSNIDDALDRAFSRTG